MQIKYNLTLLMWFVDLVILIHSFEFKFIRLSYIKWRFLVMWSSSLSSFASEIGANCSDAIKRLISILCFPLGFILVERKTSFGHSHLLVGWNSVRKLKCCAAAELVNSSTRKAKTLDREKLGHVGMDEETALAAWRVHL